MFNPFTQWSIRLQNYLMKRKIVRLERFIEELKANQLPKY